MAMIMFLGMIMRGFLSGIMMIMFLGMIMRGLLSGIMIGGPGCRWTGIGGFGSIPSAAAEQERY